MESRVSANEAQHLVASRPWWYHKFEIFPGVVTPGVYDPSGTIGMLDLPDDLTGTSILEIGPAEGAFTKALTQRGAAVTAVDYVPKHYHGFALMERLSGREFSFVQANIYDLEQKELGAFDVVLCLGVLYHLPDPFRALWILRGLTRRQLILETVISLDMEDEPIVRYFPAASNNNDITNFWAPNVLCLEMMLKDVGFLVTRKWINGNRAMFHCEINDAPGSVLKAEAAYTQPSWE